MDGVRRRRSDGGIIRLRPESSSAALAVMPQTWTPGAGGFDGLRRVAQAVAAPLPVTSPDVTFEAADYTLPTTEAPSRDLPYPTMIGLASLPMLAAAGIIGVRFYQAHHATIPNAAASTIAPTTTATPAPVAATPAPAPAPAAPVAAAVPAEAQSMQQLLDSFGQSTTYSYYVQDLKTGQLASVGPDRSFRSASFYKLFVASEIYHRIDAGTLKLTSPAGNGNTIAGCLNLMITISDNACGDALGSLIGWNSLTHISQANGYSATNLNQPMVTTPRDVAKIFQRLYAGTLNSAASNAQFLTLLKAQKVNNRLPQGLPAGTTFAHKTGDLYGYMHDGGIVYGPKTDYLVVMMGAPGAVPSNFANLSTQLYNFFEK